MEFVLADLAEAARRRRDQLRGSAQARVAQSFDRESRRLRAAGLVTTVDQLADLERRFETRRRWMRRLSPGPPTKASRRERWLDLASQRLDEEFEGVRGPMDLPALLDSVAERDGLVVNAADGGRPVKRARDRIRGAVGEDLQDLLAYYHRRVEAR